MAEVGNLNPNNNQVNERQILLICKAICSKVFSSSLLLHPAYFTHTLVQLGYEPFPLEKGKSFIFFGSNTFFLPNYYRYVNNMYLLHGFKAIYTGVGGCFLEKFSRISCGFVIYEILDRYYPEVGGNIDDLKNLNNLDNYQQFRIKLRKGIRETIEVVLCLVISRPFTVVAIRQIAQLIGNETKYLPINPFQPLLLIGAEEGPPGLFSGLMPLIVNGLISVWGTNICIYLVDIVYNKMIIKLNMKVEGWENLRPYEKQQLSEYLQLSVLLRYNVCNLIVPSLVGFVQYPFKLCSNLMAVAGSGLLASLLPYSPTFNNWFDTYNYLAQNCELYRGVMPYLRKEKGSIQVGPDNKFYGSKKYFI